MNRVLEFAVDRRNLGLARDAAVVILLFSIPATLAVQSAKFIGRLWDAPIKQRSVR